MSEPQLIGMGLGFLGLFVFYLGMSFYTTNPCDTSSLETAIDQIPSEGEWWTTQGRTTFLTLCSELIMEGFTKDQAVSFLTRAYGAVASEFGD